MRSTPASVLPTSKPISELGEKKAGWNSDSYELSHRFAIVTRRWIALDAEDCYDSDELSQLLIDGATEPDVAKREKIYQQAADLYRRAMEESTPYPEAALGLAESLMKLGKSDEALQAYIACKDQAAALGKLSSTQKRALASATPDLSRPTIK